MCSLVHSIRRTCISSGTYITSTKINSLPHIYHIVKLMWLSFYLFAEKELPSQPSPGIAMGNPSKLNNEDLIKNPETVPLLDNTPYITGGIRRQALAVAASSLGAVSMGFMLGVSAPALPLMIADDRLTLEQASWFGSLLSLGGLCTAPFGGAIADALGRKTTLLLLTLPYIMGNVLILWSPNIWSIYIGRLILGFSVGTTIVTVPAYITEVTHPSLRGRFGMSYQFCNSLGTLLVYVVGVLVGWRWILVSCCLPPTLMALLMLIVPESPRWLIDNGQTKKAFRSLCWLRDSQAKYDVIEEWDELTNNYSANENTSMVISQYITDPLVYKPFVLGIILMITQQASGVSVIRSYAFTIFEYTGFTNQGGLPSVITGLLQVIGTCGSVFIVDRMGRRSSLIITGSMATVSLVTFGISQYINLNRWVSLTCLAVYTVAYGLGCGPLPYLVISEILPRSGYGILSGLCSTANTLTAFITTKEFFTLLTFLGGPGVFWTFAVFSLLGVVIAIIWLPETKGKSLTEIQSYFKSQQPG